MPGQRGAAELLQHHAREGQQRAAWPVVDHDLPRLTRVVEVHHNNDTGVHATDVGGVDLQEAVVAAGSGVAELLVVVELFGRNDIDRTSAGPCAEPSIAAASRVTSSAKLSSHSG